MTLRSASATAAALASLVVSQSALLAPALAQSQQEGFHVALPHSRDPFSIYMPVHIPEPNFANSVRLDKLIHDGKLYVSLDDAIDLALENNLDLVISRYNLPIADADRVERITISYMPQSHGRPS